MNRPQEGLDALGCLQTLDVAGSRFAFYSLAALEKRIAPGACKLPYCVRILAENLLRFSALEELKALLSDEGGADREIPFRPARIILQDFTGVPVLVDLATMRDAALKFGADPEAVNPVIPVDLVIDHSAQVDFCGTKEAFERNLELEYRRNVERYSFMRWGQEAIRNLRVIPPATGIIHQVNLERLASIVSAERAQTGNIAFPDTVLGTDSHTTMINGLGVLGWGVGGIEAESAMLGYPVAMAVPQVIGFRLDGLMPPKATATDAVLAVTEILRRKNVVGKFVEFFGPGASRLGVFDRATIANMAPEYGATMGFFPADEKTLEFLSRTGRPAPERALVEAYLKEQGLLRTSESPQPEYSETLTLDLSTIEPCVAGPRRPHDRVPLRKAGESFLAALTRSKQDNGMGVQPAEAGKSVRISAGNARAELKHGSVVIASITSCTNTANPETMIAAGLLAKKAVEKGLAPAPFVKTSFSPGSRAVAAYLDEAGLAPFLDELGFNLTGFGCMSCIGNSGPIPAETEEAVRKGNLVVSAVISGNRNFEGRIHPLVRASYLASPPLVIAYAIAGTVNINLDSEPLGKDGSGSPVFLADLWPDAEEIRNIAERVLRPEVFSRAYEGALRGDRRWHALPFGKEPLFKWDPKSSYIKAAPYFDGFGVSGRQRGDISGARVLLLLPDFVTTDHISPPETSRNPAPPGLTSNR